MKLVKILFISLVISIVLLIIYILNNKLNNKLFNNTYVTWDSFENEKKPIERTQLYVSLLLDNLDGVVKNLSDPDIKYESKRIELNQYSDILL
jgi:hypothetical protein